MQVSAASFSQHITLKEKGISLEKIFREITKQTGYHVLIGAKTIQTTQKIDANFSNSSLKQVLDEVVLESGLAYVISDKTIIIKKREMNLLSGIIAAFSNIEVTGVVLDESGMPLPGVVVREKQNPKNQSLTSKSGKFNLEVKDGNSIIQFSYVGYTTVEWKAAEIKTDFTIKLKPMLNDLDQVQVTAYGTTTKRLNAGNITTITAGEIEKNPVNNVLQALQGKVPGLFIQQTTGQPGGAFNIRMRGSANFSSGATEPLVIVDGVRFPSGTLPLATRATRSFLNGGSGLNYINPNDIERIDVLKDVDATAIYGSSGAYGVILISTKKAKSTTATFNANIYTGVSVLGEMVPLLNTEQYLLLRREAMTNDNLQPTATDRDLNGTWASDRNTDWRDLLIGNAAATTNANFSYSGGAQNTRFQVGANFRDLGNIQRHSGTNRDGSFRFSLNSGTADGKFELSLNGNYLASKNNMFPYDFSAYTSTAAPNAPSPFHPDGTLNWDAVVVDNAGASEVGYINRLYENLTNNLLAGMTLVYKPTGKITFRSVFGYNVITGRETTGYPTASFNPATAQIASKTFGLLNQYNMRSITVSPYGEYRTMIGKKGDLSIKLGGEINNRLRNATEIMGTGFSSDALLRNPALASSVTTTNSQNEYRSIGMYGIAKFTFDNKYIVDINTRRDGSIKFGPGKRFGNFGSAALGWIFSEEKFVKNNLSWLSFGKLRVSSGIVGGDAISDFQYLGIYESVSGSYDGKTGLVPSALPNPYLEWERNFNSEAGIELAFFNNRLTADFSYYHNRASNQLLGQPLSGVTGYSSYILNSDALIRTSGTELMLNTTNIQTKHFNWSTSFNISVPKSKILKLPSQSNQNTNYVLNKPVTGVLVYKYNGINPETGYYNFTNAKGETGDYASGFTQADKTEFIDLSPKYFGGFQNSFTYKQWSLDVAFIFSSRTAMGFLGQNLYIFGLAERNGPAMWLNRWQKPGDQAELPKLTAKYEGNFRHWMFQSSSGAYQDATYARLQNLSLRYSLSPEMSRKLKVKNAAVYFQGQNLLTISKFGGLDPDNLNSAVLPQMRVFTAGITLTL